MTLQVQGAPSGCGQRPSVAAAPVLFSSPDPALVFPEGQEAVSDGDGMVELPVQCQAVPGTHPVEAVLKLADGQVLRAHLDICYGLEVSGQNQVAAAGLSTPEPLSLRLYDAQGAPRPGVPVRFYCEEDCPPLQLSAREAVTDEGGLVQIYAKGGRRNGTTIVRAEILSAEAVYLSVPYQVYSLAEKGLVFGLLGRFALFFLGMLLLSGGLRIVFSQRLKALVYGRRRSRLNDLFLGALVTALVQSSGATTDMVVGLVNAGLLSLGESVSLILGCNVGGTIFPQLLACRLFILAFPALVLGTLFRIFSAPANTTLRALARVFWGFGLVFLGYRLLEQELAPLAATPLFDSLLPYFDCADLTGGRLLLPFACCFLTAFLATALLRSSAATMGLLVILAQCRLLNLASVCPLLLGCLLGKTISVHYSAYGTSRAARRVAVIHTLTALLTALIGALAFFATYNGRPLLAAFFDAFAAGNGALGENLPRHVAMANTVCCVAAAILLLPLSSLLVWLSEKILPVKGLEGEKLYALDSRLLMTPTLAFLQLQNITREALVKGRMMLGQAQEAFMHGDFSREEEILKAEDDLDNFQRDVSSFLTWFAEYHVGKETALRIPAYIHVAHDIERIGDIAVNYLHMAKNCAEKDLLAHSRVSKPLSDYYKAMDQYYGEILGALALRDRELQDAIANLVVLRKIIQQLEDGALAEFSRSDAADMRSIKEAVLISDTITVLNRVVRHLYNIAERLPHLAQN